MSSLINPMQPQLADDQILDVRVLEAKGDGKVDDTSVLQHAIDKAAQRRGALFFPPGDYVTKELQMRPGIALLGVPS